MNDDERLMSDLMVRMADAAIRLDELAAAAPTESARVRLRGKREGVLLAHSYTEETLRLLRADR